MNATSAIAKVGSAAMKFGIPTAFALHDYNIQREEGNSVMASATSAFGSAIFWNTLGIGQGIALGLAMDAPKAAIGAFESLSAMSRNMNRNAVQNPFNNATFVDTQQAYTMRQVGMQLAQASKYNLQQTLMGNEAQYMRL